MKDLTGIKELSIKLSAAEKLHYKLLQHVQETAAKQKNIGVVRSMMIDSSGVDLLLHMKDESDLSTLTIDELIEMRDEIDVDTDARQAIEFVHWLGYSIDDETDDETLKNRIEAALELLSAAASSSFRFDGELLRNGTRALAKAAVKHRFVEVLCRMGDES